MAHVCTVGLICLFGGKAVTPLPTGPAEAMLLSVAQKHGKIEGHLTALLPSPASHFSLQFLPSFPTPHGHTWEKRLSNNSGTGFALHTAISKTLGCWECFPVLPSLGKDGLDRPR